jgi:tight adherence protein B
VGWRQPTKDQGVGRRRTVVLRFSTAAIAGLVVGVVGGAACGLAGAIACVTALSLVRGAMCRRRTIRELAAFSAGLRLFARELASGAPAAAALKAVTTSGDAASALWADLAGSPVFEGSPVAGGASMKDHLSFGRPIAGRANQYRDPGSADAEVGRLASRLRAGWAMSVRHGIPLAAIADALSRDLDARRAAIQHRETLTAGPAVSGYVLAALPGAGLALGATMGAHPVAVLTGSSVGGVLLVAGSVLTCLGLLWSDRIVGHGSPAR